KLQTSGYDRAGKWGLAQVADHLSTVIEMSRKGFPWVMPWPITALLRWLVLGSMLRRERFKRSVSTPKYMQPSPDADETAALTRLRAAIEQFEGPDEKVFPSPIFGRLTREQWRQVHLWHCEHHFSFLVPKTTENAPSKA